VPGLPPFDHLTGAMFAYAIAFGLLAPFLGRGITLLARAIRSRVQGRSVWLVAVLGLLIAGLAILFGEATDQSASNVLFSGQSALGPLIEHASDWSVGALLLLVVCKGLAYAISLSSFRGGPIFPAMFIGGAAGIAASHLPGLEPIPAVAMGIGAMSVVMLTLPFTSVLLATLLLGADGVQAMPLVIVTVVVAYVMTARITPLPATDDADQRRERPATAPTSTPMTVTR
jgi:hypothetical protein